jgi:hypothetical protein
MCSYEQQLDLIPASSPVDPRLGPERGGMPSPTDTPVPEGPWRYLCCLHNFAPWRLLGPRRRGKQSSDTQTVLPDRGFAAGTARTVPLLTCCRHCSTPVLSTQDQGGGLAPAAPLSHPSKGWACGREFFVRPGRRTLVGECSRRFGSCASRAAERHHVAYPNEGSELNYYRLKPVGWNSGFRFAQAG